MQLAAPVLAEVVPRAAILLVVLIRDQRIEHEQDLVAHQRDLRQRDHEDEVVSADVSDESLRPQHPLDHVVQNPRQEIDHPVAVVIAVAIVEFLEVIQVGVADRELLAALHAPADLALDLGGPREPRGRVHRHVPLGAGDQTVQPARLLHRLEHGGQHLIRARREPLLHVIRHVPPRDRGQRHDGRIRIRLQPAAELHPLRLVPVGVHHDELRQRAEHPLLHLRRLPQGDDRQPLAVDPTGDEVRDWTTSRRKEQDRRARPHLPPRVRVDPA